MNYESTVKKLFEHFYNKIYKTNFKLDLSINGQKKLIENFLDAYIAQHGPSIGINGLISYFVYSFEYWHSKQTKRKISLNWVIGKKFFARWKGRKDSADYYSNKWLYENNINIDELRYQLVNGEGNDNTVLTIHVSEELEKVRVPDSNERIYNCIQYTTLFNHRSLNCISCQQKKICKGMLKKINPSLYEKRGYE